MPFEWDPTILQFVEIQSIMLSGLTNDNFDFSETGEGKLQLVGWDSPTPRWNYF